jgi:aminopeptidase N
MRKDSLESSHSISLPVNNPNEINSLFDEISYDKVKKIWGYIALFIFLNHVFV